MNGFPFAAGRNYLSQNRPQSHEHKLGPQRPGKAHDQRLEIFQCLGTPQESRCTPISVDRILEKRNHSRESMAPPVLCIGRCRRNGDQMKWPGWKSGRSSALYPSRGDQRQRTRYASRRNACQRIKTQSRQREQPQGLRAQRAQQTGTRYRKTAIPNTESALPHTRKFSIEEYPPPINLEKQCSHLQQPSPIWVAGCVEAAGAPGARTPDMIALRAPGWRLRRMTGGNAYLPLTGGNAYLPS